MTIEDQNQDLNNQIGGQGASMAPLDNGRAEVSNDDPEIDDRGTDQAEALQILTSIRDGVFESNDEKLALALGRPTKEIEDWIRGAGTIDGDVVQKARALAIERGFPIE
jgi:hypothetical protein